MIFIIWIYDFDQPPNTRGGSFLHICRIPSIVGIAFFFYLSALAKGSFLGSNTV